MTRLEALKAAEELVDKLTTAPTNSRGYTVDGWRAPTLSDRVTAILTTAAFLLGEDMQLDYQEPE